ncbi:MULTISPECIES: hypothetical protein [unclassified Bradyrhizobium]|uniref:hypothetical protein n=1 Tax=unclassified Bradyrhizobium TaxID=2631580 RepID=UPI0029164DCB|nr:MULTISPECIES: hypothetical protein [unclassified Bradyrhizobium]
MGRILRSRAGTFVAIGWLLFLVSIPICFSVVVGTAISLTYFAASPDIPFDAFDNSASWIFLASVAFASVASSIALASKFRATASALVLVTWTMTIAGILVARSFVKPGPEYFERHVGQDVFLMPWTYVPTNAGVPPDKMPAQIGFSARRCLSNLGGRTDAGCSVSQDVHVLPSEYSGDDLDLKSWREYRSQMSPGPDRNGHKSFELNVTLSSGRVLVQHYYARLNPNGQLTRLVVCGGNSEKFCTTHALVGSYWFKYRAGLAEGDEVLDSKLAALIESWRRK